jgi:hypothetical protein
MEFFVSNNLPEKKEVEISVGLSVFGKTAIRKLPGSKGDKVMGEWRTKGDKVMGEWRKINFFFLVLFISHQIVGLQQSII